MITEFVDRYFALEKQLKDLDQKAEDLRDYRRTLVKEKQAVQNNIREYLPESGLYILKIGERKYVLHRDRDGVFLAEAKTL
jgi:hypothetical protein